MLTVISQNQRSALRKAYTNKVITLSSEVFAAPDFGALQLMCSLGMEQGSEISSGELILHQGGQELGKRSTALRLRNICKHGWRGY